MTRPDVDATTPSSRLEAACGELAQAARAVAACPPELGELHAVVDAAMRASTALADVLDVVIAKLPVVLDANGGRQVKNEMLADLYATRRLLTNGAALLAPAVDDTRRLLDGSSEVAGETAGETAEEGSRCSTTSPNSMSLTSGVRPSQKTLPMPMRSAMTLSRTTTSLASATM